MKQDGESLLEAQEEERNNTRGGHEHHERHKNDVHALNTDEHRLNEHHELHERLLPWRI